MVERQPTLPPYVPYRTFRNFIEQLKDGIPARIDRSVWGVRHSGTSGTQLMTALKVLDLIDPDGRPRPALERLATTDGDEHRQVLRGLLEQHYQPVFALDLSRATRAQFSEAFRAFGSREGVLRKCENFFIHAAQDAGVKLSSYILARRRGTRRSAHPGRSRSAGAGQPPAAALDAAGPTPRALAEMVLAKYPDFDPTWEPAVQERWFEGITKLYASLAGEVEGAGGPGGAQQGTSAA